MRYSASDLKNLHILQKIQQSALGPGESTANLVVQGRAQLEHSCYIVRLVLRLHAYTSIPDIY